eukprot:PLAT11262.2.p1 GENE.PLAT11262.2~~PLAT11262.2.p1  ORF type:complete len:1619 (+),score=780.24 PLAT11262.2:653-4858(+)
MLASALTSAFTVQSKDGTWTYVGRAERVGERPSTRKAVLELDARFEATRVQAQKAVAHMSGVLGGAEPFLDADLIAIRASVESMYRHDSARAARQKTLLTSAMYEQKWTDLVGGELEEHVSVSCLEQGLLFRKLRQAYASIFLSLRAVHEELLRELDEARETIEADRVEIAALEASRTALGDQLRAAHAQEMAALRAAMSREKAEADRAAKEAEEQVEKMSETLKTLNAIFRTMRNDGDALQLSELSQKNFRLESALQERERELADLRPAALELKAVKAELSETRGALDDAQRALAQAQRDVAERDALCEDLMQRKGTALSALETALVDVPDAASHLCVRCGRKVESRRGSSGASGSAGSGEEEAATSAAGEDGKAGGKDKKPAAAVEKRRVPCAMYRLFLPNLVGYRPERSKHWVLRCMRALLHSKMQLDELLLKTGRPRMRLPEFCYAWFAPVDSRNASGGIAAASAIVSSASKAAEDGDGKSGSAGDDEEDGIKAGDSAMSEADDNRWALLYGAKALSKELTEAKLFFQLLDEKHGEDELAFFCYAMRTVQSLSPVRLLWGPHVEAAQFAALAAFAADPLPDIVWVGLDTCHTCIDTVLAKASDDERASLKARTAEKGVSAEYRLLEGSGERLCVDLFAFLRLLLQAYHEEQAHRRAAVRLMFHSIASPVAADESSSADGGRGLRGSGGGGVDEEEEEEGAMVSVNADLAQFMAIVTTLNSAVQVHEALQLYRCAYDIGNGRVDANAFMSAADQLQFWGSCLRLPQRFNARASQLPSKYAAALASVVHQHVQLFRPALDKAYDQLHPAHRGTLLMLESELEAAMSSTEQGNGLDSLCAYRRLLLFLLFTRRLLREEIGEALPPTSVAERVDAELTGMESILREFERHLATDRWRAMRRMMAVLRIQRAFRARLCASAGVPLAMRPYMMRGYDARRRDNLRSLRWVLLSISHIYSEKMHTDFQDDSAARPRTLLPLFVYDYHLRRYGVRSMAEEALHDLFTAARKYALINYRACVFCLLTGISAAEFGDGSGSVSTILSGGSTAAGRGIVTLRSAAAADSALRGSAEERKDAVSDRARRIAVTEQRTADALFRHEDALAFYFKVLFMVTKHKPGASPTLFPEGEHAQLTKEQVVKLIEELFTHLEPAEQNALMTTVEELQASGELTVDSFLWLAMMEWRRECQKRHTRLVNLFRAGDVNLDNVLSFDEFSAIIADIAPDTPPLRTLRMYRDATSTSGGHGMTMEAFLDTAGRFGMTTWRLEPPEMYGSHPPPLRVTRQLLEQTWTPLRPRLNALLKPLEAAALPIGSGDAAPRLDAARHVTPLDGPLRAEEVAAVRQRIKQLESMLEKAKHDDFKDDAELLETAWHALRMLLAEVHRLDVKRSRGGGVDEGVDGAAMDY